MGHNTWLNFSSKGDISHHLYLKVELTSHSVNLIFQFLSFENISVVIIIFGISNQLPTLAYLSGFLTQINITISLKFFGV